MAWQPLPPRAAKQMAAYSLSVNEERILGYQLQPKKPRKKKRFVLNSLSFIFLLPQAFYSSLFLFLRTAYISFTSHITRVHLRTHAHICALLRASALICVLLRMLHAVTRTLSIFLQLLYSLYFIQCAHSESTSSCFAVVVSRGRTSEVCHNIIDLIYFFLIYYTASL